MWFLAPKNDMVVALFLDGQSEWICGRKETVGTNELEVWKNTLAWVQTDKYRGPEPGQWQWVHKGMSEEEKIKKGTRVSSCMYCFDLCISDSISLSLYGPSWSSDSHRFCFSQYPSVTFPSLKKLPLLVNALSQIICQQLGEGLGHFFQSFCSGEKTACLGATWEKETSETSFKRGTLTRLLSGLSPLPLQC